MSNKTFDDLTQIDQALRRAYPVGMRSSVDVTITKITGFELFNTRPYHNYETWSDGYRATDGEVTVQAEDLDDCIALLIEKRRALDAAPEEPVDE